MYSVLTTTVWWFFVVFCFCLVFFFFFSLNLVAVAAIYIRANYSLQGLWYINFPHLILRPQKHSPLPSHWLWMVIIPIYSCRSLMDDPLYLPIGSGLHYRLFLPCSVDWRTANYTSTDYHSILSSRMLYSYNNRSDSKSLWICHDAGLASGVYLQTTARRSSHLISDHLRRWHWSAFIATDDYEWGLRLWYPGVSQPYVSICPLNVSLLFIYMWKAARLGLRDQCELKRVNPMDYWHLNSGDVRQFGLQANSRIHFHDIVPVRRKLPVSKGAAQTAMAETMGKNLELQAIETLDWSEHDPCLNGLYMSWSTSSIDAPLVLPPILLPWRFEEWLEQGPVCLNSWLRNEQPIVDTVSFCMLGLY